MCAFNLFLPRKDGYQGGSQLPYGADIHGVNINVARYTSIETYLFSYHMLRKQASVEDAIHAIAVPRPINSGKLIGVKSMFTLSHWGEHTG